MNKDGPASLSALCPRPPCCTAAHFLAPAAGLAARCLGAGLPGAMPFCIAFFILRGMRPSGFLPSAISAAFSAARFLPSPRVHTRLAGICTQASQVSKLWAFQ